ncbi:MAG: macro domain-containing protein [Planctomycetota bacterium]
MTHWSVNHGDLLDCEADGLICSANPNLNLSGGVGGAFALRFGEAMQKYLHTHLREHGLTFIEPGNAVLAPSCGSPFRMVAHAVSIDGFYETNAETIAETYLSALRQLAESGCQTVASACLGCGYGRVTSTEFCDAIRRLVQHDTGVSNVTFGTTDESLAEAVRQMLREVL